MIKLLCQQKGWVYKYIIYHLSLSVCTLYGCYFKYNNPQNTQLIPGFLCKANWKQILLGKRKQNPLQYLQPKRFSLGVGSVNAEGRLSVSCHYPRLPAAGPSGRGEFLISLAACPSQESTTSGAFLFTLLLDLWLALCVTHPDSSPAGRVEVYLSQKNQSPCSYRAFLACGNCGVKPSEAEETSQISCFLDEGATASCPGWAQALSSSSRFKETQSIILLAWVQKSIWGSEAHFHKATKSKQEKSIPDASFFNTSLGWFRSPVMLSAWCCEFLLVCSPLSIQPPGGVGTSPSIVKSPSTARRSHVVQVITRAKFLWGPWSQRCSA